MRKLTAVAAGAALLALAACASDGGAAPGPPSLAEAPGAPAPPQARFYADCIAQAAGARTYDHQGTTLRFRCMGAPARAFYEGLAARSARVGSELVGEGRTFRVTQPVQRDLSGLDFCSVGPAGDHRCTVVLRVGDFLDD